MDAAARVHRAAYDRALPWLSGLHTPEEDRWFFRERVFRDCEVWGAFEAGDMSGIIAFRQDWIEQFYVLPGMQGRGVGTALLCAGAGNGWDRQRGKGAGRALPMDELRRQLSIFYSRRRIFRDSHLSGTTKKCE
jgi:GNAT superfamily N-acetyltransferase